MNKRHTTIILTAILLLPAGNRVWADDETNKVAAPAARHITLPKPTLRIGDPAPALTSSKWIKGEPVKGFETGKVYIVEFWATWCSPCRVSIPHITKLQATYPNVVIIGQNCSEREPSKVEEFVTKMGDKMNYRVALDDTSKEPAGSMYKAWMMDSGARGIPTAFIVGKDGNLAWKGHPMELDRVLPLIETGTFDPKKEAEIQTKLQDLQKDYMLAMRDKQVDKALSVLEEMKKLDPARAKDREMNKAYVLIKAKNDYAAGLAIIAKLADDEFKDNGAVLANLASLVNSIEESGKGDPALALRLAQRAVQLNGSDDLMSQRILAQVYAATGQYDKAAEAQAKVVEGLTGPMRTREDALLQQYKAKATAKLPAS